MINKIIFSALIIIVFQSCKFNSINEKVADANIDFSNAQWITDTLQIPSEESLFYLDHPAPIFRKEFEVKRNLKKAILYITAAGYYSASLNDSKIGKNYLDPAWTNFEKRIYYTEYDITQNLESGKNCLGVTLGNGFYNPLPMKMWGYLNLRDHLPVGKPQFIACLNLEYENGKSETIYTDQSWKFSYGPLVKNNVYLGEIYDARREKEGWKMVGFKDNHWSHARESLWPGGQLQKAFFPPIQITDIIDPIEISAPNSNSYLVDMGVNFTGLYRIRLKGKTGDTIQFRFGERIYDDGTLNPMTTVAGQIKRKDRGGPGAPEIAWQTDSYIFGEEEDTWYSPVFTFHTWRYMEISGLEIKPEIKDIQGLAFNTKVDTKNSFSSSSELLNSIQEATSNTFLANLQSVQSDCPAREKFGYGGDLIATGESYIYNFDMQSIYRKTIYDWFDAINDSVFIDTAPFVGIKYCGLSWESAFLITQYYHYLYYNDTDLIEEMYDADLKWMNKVERLHPRGVIDKGLSDHESLEPVPVELIGTNHYLQCALIMAEFASFMGDVPNEEKFEKLALKLTKQLSEMFWKKSVPDPINRQTLFSTLLYNEIVPHENVRNAVDSLLKALNEGPSGHFNTGIFGTKYILETLSRAGKINEVYSVVNSRDYPGWGFMIDRGATTLWETWKESDNTYSNCHPMFGSVTEWFYRWLGGIKPDPENPGFEKFFISPNIPDGLKYVNCTYYSPFGKIVSNWELKEADNITFEVVVPDGSIALVILPFKQIQNIEIIDKTRDKTYSPEKNPNLAADFELKGGEYLILVKTINPDQEN